MSDQTTAVAAPPAAGAIHAKPASIKDTVLAQFKATETGLTEMADRYRNVAYAVATTKGMAEAKAARADLRDNGRLMITRTAASVRADVNELRKVMGDEVDRLVAIVEPVEEAIDKQIKAEEKRKADEKAERDRKEAERVEGHRVNIEQMRAYLAQAEGQPLDTIRGAIDKLLEMAFGDEWEEFAQQAQTERDNTVAGLRALVQREEQRIENENLRAQLAALQAAQAPSAQPAPQAANQLLAPAAEQGVSTPLFEVDDWASGDAAPDTTPPAGATFFSTPAGAGMTVGGGRMHQVAPDIDMEPDPEPVDDGMRITMGQIKEHIAPLGIDAAGLEKLGFKHLSAGGAAKLYRACDLPAIVFAMVEHLNARRACPLTPT